MGSHRHKKKYESESSSSESEEASSSSDTKAKSKKRSKKTKHSSSEESEDEKSSKSRSKRTVDESDREKHKKQHRLNESEEKNIHKSKERDHHYEKYEESKYEERHKSRHKSTDRDRSRDREKSRDKDVDELRNKKDYSTKHQDYSNNKERYEDRDRNRRQDNRRDDRRSFRDRDSREHRFDNEDHRSRDRFENRGRRDYNRHGNRGRRSSSFDHANAKWGKNNNDESKSGKKDPQQKEKPNFGLSGKLTEETNTYKGVVIKYSEPPEARKPRRRWRLYPFKGEKALQTLYIHRESAYLIGRERKVVDLPVDHPSCSKQHAALQYRLVPFTRDDGTTGKRVRPYIIDLDSANGTFINNKKIEPKKYVELLEKDVIKFGFSSREYVLLHENSKDEAMDDDVKQEEEEIPIKEEPQ